MSAWDRDCLKWRRRVLAGEFSHWCDDWDGLPMDETCMEFPCSCYRDEVYWVEQDWDKEARRRARKAVAIASIRTVT